MKAAEKKEPFNDVNQGEVNPLISDSCNRPSLTRNAPYCESSLIRKKRASISRATSYTTRRAATISPKEPEEIPTMLPIGLESELLGKSLKLEDRKRKINGMLYSPMLRLMLEY
ncbi:hypothetical protein Tco_1370448 [Tanacetum coccineum]